MNVRNAGEAMTMNARRRLHATRHRLLSAVALIASALWISLVSAQTSAPSQRTFPTPDAAVEALAGAVQSGDRAALLRILGQAAEQWIGSGDRVADRAAKERFATAFAQKHAIVTESEGRATLAIGPDDWPFAFPLVKSANGWRFDTEAGRQEMLARRVGANELAAINVLLAIVDAQRDYASEDRNSDGVREYARKFASTAGRRDGLYWPTKAGEPASPLGPLVVRATSEGYTKGETPQPYHGYHFRPLLGQGSHAPGGEQDYIVRGRMIGGFAALAYPARYGSSGVMTFVVSHAGTVYEKDLGADTAKAARAISRFDPGDGWKPVSPQ
jgi:hypothetical protein